MQPCVWLVIHGVKSPGLRTIRIDSYSCMGLYNVAPNKYMFLFAKNLFIFLLLFSFNFVLLLNTHAKIYFFTYFLLISSRQYILHSSYILVDTCVLFLREFSNEGLVCSSSFNCYFMLSDFFISNLLFFREPSFFYREII